MITIWHNTRCSKSRQTLALLIAAMAAHPILIERPIVFTKTRAALGRPPVAVLDIL